MVDDAGLSATLQPLPGGFSGESFLAEVAGEQSVVRIYGPRSAWRGPLAPEVDAAVLDLVRGLLPVPRVLEVRRGDPASDLPGLLVTTRLPGERLDQLLPALAPDQVREVGERLGVLAARLGHMVQPGRGVFANRSLRLVDGPPGMAHLPTWLEQHANRLDAALVEGLGPVVDAAQDLLDGDLRACLVHGDLNPKNLLVDPATLEVTGVLDWEFAHSGLPWADLGNLLRGWDDGPFLEGALGGYRSMMVAVPDDVLARARAADLFASIELAARDADDESVRQARAVLAGVARAGHPGAAPGTGPGSVPGSVPGTC